MLVAQAGVHPPPPTEYRPADDQDEVVALTSGVYSVSMTHFTTVDVQDSLMATYLSLSWMVAEEASHQSLNCILTIIVIVGYCAEMLIVILVMDRSSASPGTGRNRRRRTRAAPLCYDLRRR